MTTLYLAVPCYNEQEVLPDTTKKLLAKMRSLIDCGKISPDSRIMYIDDGSKDSTWSIISELHEKYPLVAGLTAGLWSQKGTPTR